MSGSPSRARSRSTPEGKVSAVIHDWVFDEMYSSFATQGLAPAGQLVKKEQFAPLAKENAGSLAEIGYFTTLKIGGVAADFGSVTDYWMQERPDHLVEFHVTLPLKTPTPVSKFLTLRVADPEYFIDFEFDDKDPVKLVSAPSGCTANVAKPKPLEANDKQKLSESFFTNLSPGSQFRFQNGERRHRRVPMTKRSIVWISLGCAAWSASALARAGAAFVAAVRGRRRRGRRRRRRRRHGLAHGPAIVAHPSHRRQGARAERQSAAPLGASSALASPMAWSMPRAPDTARRSSPPTCWPMKRRSNAARSMALMAALLQALIAIALVGAAGFVFQATASRDESGRQLDRARELLRRRRDRRLAGLAEGRGARSRLSVEHVERRRAVGFHPGLCRRRMGAARVQPFGGRLTAPGRPTRIGGRRTIADTCICPIRLSSTAHFHGGPRLAR